MTFNKPEGREKRIQDSGWKTSLGRLKHRWDRWMDSASLE